jgi:hypothetical protein
MGLLRMTSFLLSMNMQRKKVFVKIKGTEVQIPKGLMEFQKDVHDWDTMR